MVLSAYEKKAAEETGGSEFKNISIGSKLGLSCTAGKKRRLKLDSSSDNIGELEPIDEGASTPGKTVLLTSMKNKGGLILDPSAPPLHRTRSPSSS